MGGESKQQKIARARFFEKNPVCCFCGGSRSAATVDHVPPRILFRGKLRPKGLEAPACLSCNNATRTHEQAVALVARIFPDPPSERDHKEVGRILASTENNLPGFLLEMYPRKNYSISEMILSSRLGRRVHFLETGGPHLNTSMVTFGRKIGLAFHYFFAGRIVPPSGGMYIQWHTNYDLISGRFPEDIMKKLPGPMYLAQGKNRVDDQFSYSYISHLGADRGLYAIFVNQAFAIFTMVWENLDHCDFVDKTNLWPIFCAD